MSKTIFFLEHNEINYEMEFDSEQGTLFALKKDEFGGYMKFTTQKIGTRIYNLEEAKEVAPQMIDALGAF